MRKSSLVKTVCFLLLSTPLILFAQASKKQGEFYQVTVYHFDNNDQQKMIDNYLKAAYLPALHRQKIKSVGVFTPISNDTAADKRLYVVYPVRTLQEVADLAGRIDRDNEYITNGKEYMNVPYDKPAYSRKENILLKSFPLAPSLVVPKLKSAVTDKIYELRSYEGASEKIFVNKVQMFNEGGEVDIFKRLNFNAVFYASVIAGCRTPNLMYMTSFENMAEREAHWKSFSADPQWKTLSAMPGYQHNVSKIDITLMKATEYSDY